MSALKSKLAYIISDWLWENLPFMHKDKHLEIFNLAIKM